MTAYEITMLLEFRRVLFRSQSEFMTLPRGKGFVEYDVFEQGYEHLKRATGGFRKLAVPAVLKAVCEVPISFVVLRSVLGFRSAVRSVEFDSIICDAHDVSY